MNNCGCKRPAVGPEPHAPVPLHGGGFVPNAIEWLKEKIDRLFGTAVFTVNGHEPEGGNVDVIVPSKVSELENDAGYLTEHQDVSGIASTAEEALSVATDAAENSVRAVNGKTPTAGSVKIVLDDLADKDGNIETTKTIMVSRDGGESHVAVALYSDLIGEIDTHNNDVAAHTKLMATVARIYATKTEVGDKYDKTGGPISGDVSISGSLSLTGSAPKITANQKDFSFPAESGKLARAEDYYTTAEVDNKITTFVAHYLTGKDSAGHFVPFATRAALDYAKQHHTEEDPQFFYAGEPFTPTKNDYCVVLADETVGGKTARYSFVGEWPTGSWQYQYTINDTAFSEAQWAAINSGVTGAWMESTLSALQSEVDRAKAAETQLTTKANELDTSKADKATTLAGYGITDAATKKDVEAKADKTALQSEVDRAQAAEAQLTTKANELDTAKLDKTGGVVDGDIEINGRQGLVVKSSPYYIGFRQPDGSIVYLQSLLDDKLDAGGTAANSTKLGGVEAGKYALKSNIPAVVAPSASATAGQAADAKAVNDALAGKVDNAEGVVEYSLEVINRDVHTILTGNAIVHGQIGDDVTVMLPNKSGTFAITSDIEDAISGKANKSELPYSLVVKEIKNGTVSLDDRADNYVDARTLGTSGSLDIDFPVLVDGRSRDFVLAIECGENPPTISYAAFATIMSEDASTLTPEPGMNIYAFTEFKTNMFLVARKTVATVVVNTPESSNQVLLAMQKRGIDTTNITDFGKVANTLGLGDTATPQDAIDAVMN